MIRELLISMRPKQWLKNLFIFAGIIFSQNFFNVYFLIKVTWAFFIFCLLSGSIYLLNDIIDIKEDRCHTLKCKRPLAAGRLKASRVLFYFVLFSLLSLVLALRLDFTFFLFVCGYFLLQLAYSLFLKQVIILDIFVVSAGFLLRVMAGAAVIDVVVSPWLIICTIFLSLFLVLGKRKHDILMDEKHKHNIRILREYSPHFLDQMISVVTSSTLIAYCLYTTSRETILKFGTPNLVFTIPFVLYGIFRYLYLIYHKQEGGYPESIIITDKPLLAAIVLWAITVGVILYG